MTTFLILVAYGAVAVLCKLALRDVFADKQPVQIN